MTRSICPRCYGRPRRCAHPLCPGPLPIEATRLKADGSFGRRRRHTPLVQVTVARGFGHGVVDDGIGGEPLLRKLKQIVGNVDGAADGQRGNRNHRVVVEHQQMNLFATAHKLKPPRGTGGVGFKRVR